MLILYFTLAIIELEIYQQIDKGVKWKMAKAIKYKGFKIIPVTEKVCDKYSTPYDTYMEGEFLIVNPDDEFEWQDSTIEICKQWIDSY